MLKRTVLVSAIFAFLGIAMILLGIWGNRAAMDANGGKMPVLIKPEYRAELAEILELELVYYGKNARHVPMTEKSRLQWLCDRYYIVKNGQFVGVESLGDILLTVGDRVSAVSLVAMFVAALFELILTLLRGLKAQLPAGKNDQ